MTKTVDDYAGLVTPWQAKPIKARFLATVRADALPYADAQAAIASMPGLFDLDVAVGDQLDKTGEWVGQSRGVPITLPSLYFSADIAGLGADEGYAAQPYGSGYSTSYLPDPYYRKLLRAKVLANRWDGTAAGLQAILTTYFDDSATLVFIDDKSGSASPALFFAADDAMAGADVGVAYPGGATGTAVASFAMQWLVAFAGKIPAPADLAILTAGILPVKPMGADVQTLVTTVDGAPLFGADMDNAYVSGADIGAADGSPAYVASLAA
ncbi:DUF2612 domain-containing protein [Methylobacterium sp. NMS14P]|uniref:DUF2612 domain-containing protein n=1 Tax=Methylobacterium sp. NMS14P TaxID=2894310 RepID=UPI002358AD59|nr:DUF2612 domain-containing protein [Methylobacterium sp. NMS14P]WCS27222.1 DUF2612 domain-containing protein [Methylobacterium sp. NMS14P]